MKQIAILIILSLLVGSSRTYCQEINHLHPFFKNTTIIHHFKNRISRETTYLGSFTFENNRYHVYKEFVKIQAANAIHGNSFIYITSGQEIIKTFHFDMPYELPLGLNESELIYEFENVPLIENGTLTDIICTDQYGCYFSHESF